MTFIHKESSFHDNYGCDVQMVHAFSISVAQVHLFWSRDQTNQRKADATAQNKITNSQITWNNFLYFFQKLVCKSDQLIKRRAKSGLITVNKSWNEVKEWVKKFINKEFTVRYMHQKLADL